MKKVYSQPDILFESFSLYSSIASGDCGVKITTQYDGECGLPYGDKVVFTDAVAGCLKPGSIIVSDENAIFNGLCYHVPIGNLNLFNS